MNAVVAVLIPVLERPHRVQQVVDSLYGSIPRDDVRLEFICNHHDDEEIRAVRAAGLEPRIVPWDPGRGDYAKKLNLAYRETPEEWSLLAADDIVFHVDWFKEAMKTYRRLGEPCVIGTNDLGNPRVMRGLHSVYTLVHRNYADCGTIDDEDVLLHEGYWHNYVDDEFVQTAMYRDTYAHSFNSHIEHLHPDWKKGEWDATYTRGRAHFAEDGVYYADRRPLFNGGMPHMRKSLRRARRR